MNITDQICPDRCRPAREMSWWLWCHILCYLSTTEKCPIWLTPMSDVSFTRVSSHFVLYWMLKQISRKYTYKKNYLDLWFSKKISLFMSCQGVRIYSIKTFIENNFDCPNCLILDYMFGVDIILAPNLLNWLQKNIASFLTSIAKQHQTNICGSEFGLEN